MGISNYGTLPISQDVITYDGHDNAVRSVSVSGDGRFVAAGSKRGRIKIWDTRAGQLAHEVSVPKGRQVHALSFHPDNTLLAAGLASGTVQVFDVSTGQSVLAIEGHKRSVSSVCFGPNGDRVVTSGSDGAVKLWDVTTGQGYRQF